MADSARPGRGGGSEGSRGPDPGRRRTAQRHGRRAEWIAAWMLRLKGYRILGRDIRTPVGEIDLLARRGKLVIVVEVKSRADPTDLPLSVTRRQQLRILRATEYLRASGRLGQDVEGIRFDVVTLSGHRWPKHLPDMWRP